jgi:hypothetical protein
MGFVFQFFEDRFQSLFGGRVQDFGKIVDVPRPLRETLFLGTGVRVRREYNTQPHQHCRKN